MCENIKLISANDAEYGLSNADFVEIARLISTTATMLPKTAESLFQAYSRGQSVVMLSQEGEVVGHVSVSALLDDELKKRLGLGEDLPDILEVGGAYIKEDWRGNGRYASLRNALYQLHLITDENTKPLIIGTTAFTGAENGVMRSLVYPPENVSITALSHHELPFVAALTCVCDNQSSGMLGMQHGCDACPSRVNISESPFLQANFQIPLSQEAGRTKSCVLHVSDLDLAKNIDKIIRKKFRTQQKFVDALQALGYY